jgi:hypothetical protein
MLDSWDIPPCPTKGDDEVDATYAGVGRVISQWEMIEVELSQIYAWLVKRPEEIDAVRLYGEGKRIFEERIKGLLLVADHCYFQWNPHQETEGELRALVRLASNFAARRNDVAHCIVRPFQWIVSPGVRRAATILRSAPGLHKQEIRSPKYAQVYLHVSRTDCAQQCAFLPHPRRCEIQVEIGFGRGRSASSTFVAVLRSPVAASRWARDEWTTFR